MSESQEEIMEATRKALSKHSYSELSIQNIADEFDKSKSLLYHHYDGKDEILLDFLDYMLDEFEEEALSNNGEDIKERLKNEAFMAFCIPQQDDFIKTLIELRTQALRNDEYMEKFQKFEDAYRENLVKTLEKGKKQGELSEDIQPEKTAEFISAINNEAMFKKAADQETDQLRDALEGFLQCRVY